jgi:putative oxidoreductase
MSSLTSKLPIAARILLGLVFTVFGLNFFLHFLPEPKMDAVAGGFLGALATGKILTVVKVIEVGTGVMLLSNRFVPLALTLLAPVLVGILLFHAVFAPAGIVLPLILTGLAAYLARSYRAAFAPMLQANAKPE